MKHKSLKAAILAALIFSAGSLLALAPGVKHAVPGAVSSMSLVFSQDADTTSEGTAPDSLTAMLEQKTAALFSRSCATSGCHRGKNPKKGLGLEPEVMRGALVDMPSRQHEELKLVDTEYPEKSYLLMKIEGSKGISGKKMPIWGAPLKPEEIEIIERWIGRLSKESETPERETEE